MATSVKRQRSASCCPKVDSGLFYPSIQRPVVLALKSGCLIKVLSVIHRKTVDFVSVTSVCKMSGVDKDNSATGSYLS